ncbi:bud site selection protein [Cladochytrium tenue]|nr:bud site selection protein [Cladochytrium tenue]
MASKADVLARYLSRDTIPEGAKPASEAFRRAAEKVGSRKKKKRDAGSSKARGLGTSIVVDDDDSDGFGGAAWRRGHVAGDDDDTLTPVVVEGIPADEKSRFSAGSWEVLSGGVAAAAPGKDGSDPDPRSEIVTKGKRRAEKAVAAAARATDRENALAAEDAMLLEEAEVDGRGETVEDVKRMMEEQGIQVTVDDGVALEEIMGRSAAPIQSLELRKRQEEVEKAAMRHVARPSAQSDSRRRRRTPTSSESEQEHSRDPHSRGGRHSRRTPSPSDEEGGESRRRRRRSPSASRSPDRARLSGRDADTIYRDKRGRLRDIDAERAEEEAKVEQRKRDDQERFKFRTGVVQDKAKQNMRDRLDNEKRTAFAQYADDAERNAQLREVERWGDPMARMGLAPKKSTKPRYSGPTPPPNRFKIPPGYRWDGVDRGNGFEAKLIQSKYTRAVRVEEAYKWSTEDM